MNNYSSTTVKSASSTTLPYKIGGYMIKRSNKWYKRLFYKLFKIKVPYYVVDWNKVRND